MENIKTKYKGKNCEGCFGNSFHKNWGEERDEKGGKGQLMPN